MAPNGPSTSRSYGPVTQRKRASRKPQYSRFTQQELPACKLMLTPTLVISTFASIGLVFIPIGLASLSASKHVVEVAYRYDIDCVPSQFMEDKVSFIQNSNTKKNCSTTLTVPKFMKGPIHIYYQLNKFYQNHRRYVKSRDDKQLRYKGAENETTNCSPEAKGSNGSAIVPCGLIAWSLFNDTYSFATQNKSIEVNKKNIAWQSDKDHKYGTDIYPKNFQMEGLIGGDKLDASLPLSEQEDLIVWMRTAAMPTFRKLYGRIEADFAANEQITVTIENRYNTYSFEGEKTLVLSTTSWLGGLNNFIGTAYITVGGLCLVIAIGFMVLYLLKPRTLGDPSYLSWTTNPGGLH